MWVPPGFHCLRSFFFLFLAWPNLLHQFNDRPLTISFFSRTLYLLFLFISELMDLFLAGRDQSAADQQNNLAEAFEITVNLLVYECQ